jgi:hypothetical protein
MCCSSLKKTAKVMKDIAVSHAYLVAGTNEELSQRRMKICANCPHLRGGIVCSKCGCDMPAKTRLPESQCEDENNRRWLAEPEYKVA